MNALATEPALESTGQRPSTGRHVLVFRVAGQAYGVPLSIVKEIVSMPLLSQPPGLPSVLAGFLNLAGSAVAVIRLDHLFAASKQTTRLYTPLLILHNVGLPLAVIVEDVVGIVVVADSAILPLPDNSSFNKCAVGVATVDAFHIIILSPGQLLLRAEQQRVADLAALEHTRLAELRGGTP